VIQQWIKGDAELFVPQDLGSGRQRLKPLQASQKHPWRAFETLLNLPQVLAQSLGRRVVLILQSFPTSVPGIAMGLGKHFYGERSSVRLKWLCPGGNDCTSTHPEETSNSLEIVQLFPLADDIVAALGSRGPACTRADFDPRSQALELFRCSAGTFRRCFHWFDAYKLCKRLTANSQFPGTAGGSRAC